MTKIDALNRINEFENLKFNWNGYGALPISQYVIKKSIGILEVLDPLPDNISPTGRNSIQFEWYNKGLYLEIEIFEDKISIFNDFRGDYQIGGD